MLEMLQKLFGTNEDGTPKALTYDELEKAAVEGKLKVADLTTGAYVSKDKYDAKETELAGVKKQLDDANAEIKGYVDMDIDGIKKKVSDWEEKYNADTAALNEQLAAKERQHQLDRFFDKYEFTSVPARKGIMEDFEAKQFKLEDGKFLGGEEFMKSLMESEDYKGAFVVHDDSNGSDGSGNGGEGNGNGAGADPSTGKVPFFSTGTQSSTADPKSSVFNFGFSGVRKHE